MTKSIFICYALDGERIESLRHRLELITLGARDANMCTYAHIRDAQNWVGRDSDMRLVLSRAFHQIKSSDAVLLDLTSEFGSKRVGLNIEAGYAKALKKPIVALYHRSDRPYMTTDLADFELPYSNVSEIRNAACQLLSKISWVGSPAIR